MCMKTPKLSKYLGVPESTIYTWLNFFEPWCGEAKRGSKIHRDFEKIDVYALTLIKEMSRIQLARLFMGTILKSFWEHSKEIMDSASLLELRGYEDGPIKTVWFFNGETDEDIFKREFPVFIIPLKSIQVEVKTIMEKTAVRTV